MKNKRINIKTIIIIVLTGIIIALVISNFNNKNTNIKKQEIDAEQLTQTTSNNAYVDMATHLSEVTNGGGMKLLWEGTEESYANGYSIDMDLSSYSHVLVFVKYKESRSTGPYFLCKVGESVYTWVHSNHTQVTTDTAIGYRTVSVTESRITFTDAVNVKVCLPCAIYGISSIS